MKIDGQEVEVWQCDRPDTVFHLHWRGTTFSIYKCYPYRNWIIVNKNHVLKYEYGHKSGPLSFLIITGHCIEEVWQLGKQIGKSGDHLTLGR